MNLITQSLQLLTIIAGLIIFHWIKAYFPKYWEAKASNRASKEDIGILTKIVEEIKTELSQKTEQLKAQLSLINQHTINLKNSERDALFDFNKKLTTWLNTLIYFHPSSITLDNYKSNDLSSDSKQRRFEFFVSKSHLNLFLKDDPDFSRLIADITLCLIGYEAGVQATDTKLKTEHLLASPKLEAAKSNPTEYRIAHNVLQGINLKLWNEFEKENKPKAVLALQRHKQITEIIFDKLRRIEGESVA